MELTYRISNITPHKIIKTEKYWTNTVDAKLIDILCGNTAFIFGYDNDAIINKMVSVQKEVGFLKGLSNETCDSKDELVNFLCQEGNFYSVAWAVSGSDGVELAFYINQQYWESINEYKPLVVVFNPGYHGTTFLAKSFRTDHVRSVSVNSPSWEYVDDRDSSEEESFLQLEELLKSNKDIGAILMEACPWINGIKPWSENWWKKIRSLCDKYNINFIVDDVFAGVGKLGHYFSHNRYNVQPDIAILGKSLTNGYSPLSCACVNERISIAAEPYWDYSHTWSPNMGGIGAALAVKDLFNKHEIGLVEKSLENLCQWLLDNNVISNYISIGLLASLTLTKTYPIDAFILNGINGFASDNNQLKICAPAIADKEYFDTLKLSLERALLNT